MLDIRDLNITIGNRQIIHDVSMTIDAGARVGLIGSSGSGKSMISRAVMGLLPVDATVSGSIQLAGHELVDLNDHEMAALRGSTMSMVFQNPRNALNPVLTVGQQIALPLKLHYALSREDRERRVRAMLERVELPQDVFARSTGELSGGQQQRVAIATALITSPRLIIADEPTTALDSTTQWQICRLLTSLVDDLGAAMLFITHDFSVLAHVTTRCVVLDAGRVVEQGSTRALLDYPAHEQTRSLVQAAQALSLHGTAEASVDRVRSEEGGIDG
ncbi:diguanylate cyclase [Bifidobacterium gallicum DSM 20093 = LMG 11596]|nr:diguanylate cyclase [Bifidobacterium gallicum DSM 20093 = LMG 11596]